MRGRIRVNPAAYPGTEYGPVSMDHLSLGMDLDAEVRPMGTLVFGRVNAGSLGFRSCSAERWYAPGDVYLAGQPWQRRTVMARGGEHEQTVIDTAFISQVADQAPGSEARPVRFARYEPVSPQAAGMWKSACDYVHHIADGRRCCQDGRCAPSVFPRTATGGPRWRGWSWLDARG